MHFDNLKPYFYATFIQQIKLNCHLLNVDASDLAAWETTFGQVETTPLVGAASGNVPVAAQSAVLQAAPYLSIAELIDVALPES